jgi:hypothetical protein
VAGNVNQLIGVPGVDEDIAQLHLVLSKEEYAMFKALQGKKEAVHLPIWLWSVMHKPVFQRLLNDNCFGALEIAASRLGRLSIFHGKSKDDVLIDLISSEDVRDVFCEYVAHIMTKHEDNHGLSSKKAKNVAIFNSTSYKAMAALQTWTRAAHLFFEHQVYYAPNPVTQEVLDEKIRTLEQAFNSRSFDYFDAITDDDTLESLGQVYMTRLGNIFNRVGDGVFYNKVQSYYEEYFKFPPIVPRYDAAQRYKDWYTANVNLDLQKRYNRLADQVDRQTLSRRVSLFLQQAQISAAEKARLEAIYVKDSTLDLSNYGALTLNLYTQYAELQKSLATRRYQKMIIRELGKLLAIAQRERNSYRAQVLKVSE